MTLPHAQDSLQNASYKNAHTHGSRKYLTIRQGRIDLFLYRVVGEIFTDVLRDPRFLIGTSGTSSEVKVDVFSAPHADAFAALKDDQTNIPIGWFVGSHGACIEPFRDDVVVPGDSRQKDVPCTPAVHKPYCIWTVPSYIPETIVPDVPRLAEPWVAARFKVDDSGETRTLPGINPGAGISRISPEMIQSYNLASQRLANQVRHVVFPLWQLQYLHAIHGLRALIEPKGLLRAVDEARLIVSKRFLAKLSEHEEDAFLNVMRRVTLGNDDFTQMDKHVHVDKVSYHDAAQRWICRIQAHVDSWFESGHHDIVQRASETSAYALPNEDIHSTLAGSQVMAIPDNNPAAAGAYEAYSISSHGLTQTCLQLPRELSHNLTAGSPPKLAFVDPVSKSRAVSASTAPVVTEQQAYQAIRTYALNLLAQLRVAAGGDLACIKMHRLEGYVATSDTHENAVDVPRILDAASLLIKHALGPKPGSHARTALISNPLNVTTMLGAVAELRW